MANFGGGLRFLLVLPESIELDESTNSFYLRLVDGMHPQLDRVLPQAEQRPLIELYGERLLLADALITDVSTESPDAYYWIGRAHALRKPILVLSNGANPPHFNISAFHVAHYHSERQIKEKIDFFVLSVEEKLATLQNSRADFEVGTDLGEIQKTAYLPILVEQTVEEIHSHLCVSAMEPRDSERDVEELPAGVFGFFPSFLIERRVETFRKRLHEDPVIGEFTLDAVDGLSGVEVAKDEHSVLYLIGAIIGDAFEPEHLNTRQGQSSLSLFVAIHREGRSGIWTTNKRGRAGRTVAVPFSRIMHGKERRTSLGSIVDLQLSSRCMHHVDCG